MEIMVDSKVDSVTGTVTHIPCLVEVGKYLFFLAIFSKNKY